MRKIQFLTKEEYINHVKDLDDGHWTKNTISDRWDYHYRTIELVKALKLDLAKDVLEMGTMGVSCIKGSDTIDFSESWDFKGKNPNYNHDAREFPWPIEDKKYEVFIALRVFQHLVPVQTGAIHEAFRIAKKIVIVIPEFYDNPLLPSAKGYKYEDFVTTLNGVHPNLYLPTAFGNLFYWDVENPSYLNLNAIMDKISLIDNQNPKIEQSISDTIDFKAIVKNIFKKNK